MAAVVGVGLGAILGALFAPRSGAETRRRLNKTANKHLNEAADAGREYARQTKKGLRTAADQAREYAEDLADSGVKAFREAREAQNG